MLEGIERYLVSKSSERAAQHNIVNMFMEMTMKRLEKEMSRLLEKIVLGIGEELQFWNGIIKKMEGVDLRIHLIERSRLNPITWHLIVQGYYFLKPQKDEYILGWQKKKPPSRTFKLHKIEYINSLNPVTRKICRFKHKVIKTCDVQADTKMIAFGIVGAGMGYAKDQEVSQSQFMVF